GPGPVPASCCCPEPDECCLQDDPLWLKFSGLGINCIVFPTPPYRLDRVAPGVWEGCGLQPCADESFAVPACWRFKCDGTLRVWCDKDDLEDVEDHTADDIFTSGIN